MTYQLTFSDRELNNKCRKTRKEIFITRLNTPMPWERLETKIEPFYPKEAWVDDLTLFRQQIFY